MITYPPLTVRDDGRVFLDGPAEADAPELVGHITEDANPFDHPKLAARWAWLLQEWRDGLSAGDGYRAAVDAAWFARLGTPS